MKKTRLPKSGAINQDFLDRSRPSLYILFMAFYRYILLGLFTLTLCRAQTPPPEILEAEIRELKTVVKTLREENQMLEARNRQLAAEVQNLNRQLREQQASPQRPTPVVTSPRTAEPRPEVMEAATGVKATMHQVIYVNPNWHYLIVKAGSQSGIKVGESGSVMRDGEIIATVMVTDTKENQCVVELDLNSLSRPGIYPSKTDRVRFP